MAESICLPLSSYTFLVHRTSLSKGSAALLHGACLCVLNETLASSIQHLLVFVQQETVESNSSFTFSIPPVVCGVFNQSATPDFWTVKYILAETVFKKKIISFSENFHFPGNQQNPFSIQKTKQSNWHYRYRFKQLWRNALGWKDKYARYFHIGLYFSCRPHSKHIVLYVTNYCT